MTACALCGDEYNPATEAHMIENLCYSCLFDPERIEDDDSCGDPSDSPVITFGEDLEVPAFIRNRQE